METKNTTDFYVIVKDGHGNDERQLNFDNPQVCPRKGMVELVPLKERKTFDNRVSFRRFVDRSTKCNVGIPERIDPKTKEFVYKQITIIGRRMYDLTNENDAKEWACIKLSSYLQGSPNQSVGNAPIYKVYDKEKQASETITKADDMVRAIQVAQTLQGANLTDMLNVCGVDSKGMSETMKQSAILNFAMREPVKFLGHWESPERKENFLLKRALALDIIQMDHTLGTFSYNGLQLGPTEPAAVDYLKQNQNVSIAVSTLVKQKEQDTEKAAEIPKAANNADLLAEIAELKKRLAEAPKQVIVNQMKEDGLDIDHEHQALLTEAKALKIKGAHLFDKDKLIKKIAEAKG